MSNEENLKYLETQLNKIYENLQEIIDYSVNIRTDKEMKKKVNEIWQHFLNKFFGYIRQKSKDTGENLIAGIAFSKIWR